MEHYESFALTYAERMEVTEIHAFSNQPPVWKYAAYSETQIESNLTQVTHSRAPITVCALLTAYGSGAYLALSALVDSFCATVMNSENTTVNHNNCGRTRQPIDLT